LELERQEVVRQLLPVLERVIDAREVGLRELPGERRDVVREQEADPEDEVALLRREPPHLALARAAVSGLLVLGVDAEHLVGSLEAAVRRVVEALVAEAADVEDETDLLLAGPGRGRRLVGATR